LQLARLRAAIDRLEGALVVTADHGNADEMYEHGKDGHVVRDSISGVPVVKTSHTVNPVPFMIHDAARNGRYQVEAHSPAGIANVTATCYELLGFVPPEGLEPSLLRFKP
jgi:2,3-bisphosphoglycerate-independent phosphoglycerate mutase